MFTTFAHAGHAHTSSTAMSAIDHCLPFIAIASLVIFILLGVITYMLFTWQPKSFTQQKKTLLVSKKKPSKK